MSTLKETLGQLTLGAVIGFDVSEGITIGIAVLVALGVYSVPNKPR